MATAFRARVLYLGMEKEETLVFGHTHEPHPVIKNCAINLNSGSFNNQTCLDRNSNLHLLKNRSLFF